MKTRDELDAQIKFLREQASRLRSVATRPGQRWAEGSAARMDEIVETIMEFRREMMMTGMNGKRIE